jgi:hypothetical protein
MERLAVKRERKRTKLLEQLKICPVAPETYSKSCDYEYRKRKKKVLITESPLTTYSPDLTYIDCAVVPEKKHQWKMEKI